MPHSLSGAGSCRPPVFAASCCFFPRFLLLLFSAGPSAKAQSAPSGAAPRATCPVQILHFNPDGVSVRIRNASGEAIVGLVFNAALADAAEHWKWYHWDFADSRPIREFGWNKTIKAGAAKSLS
jgi:hypothetical protein